MPEPAAIWPWIALAGLGAFHGLNPAMGWLFAVALGLHRGGRRTVLVSLAPIALGHAASVALVVALVLAFGLVVEPVWLGRIAGVGLIGWAVWHVLYGHKRRVRIGMSTGLLGLAVWSFLMASAHGAGLMVIPIVVPLCLTGTPGADLVSAGGTGTALAALAVHTFAMFSVITAIAVLVHDRLGLAFLRTGWVNLDLVWAGALALAGLVLLLT